MSRSQLVKAMLTQPTPSVAPTVTPHAAWITGTPIPRPRETFDGLFGPLQPITPLPVDRPPQGAERPAPRRWQYPVGWNMPIGVPGSEWKLVPFATLRQYADLYSICRACIQVRKEEILALEWDIVPTAEGEKVAAADRAARAEQEAAIRALKTFFAQPDPDYYNFHSWLSALLEEVFVVDALALYLHPSRERGKGVLGSDLAALELLDGTTIRPLLDHRGQTPRPPAPAYQQYLYGVPRVDLLDVILGRDVELLGEEPVREYRADQLLYLPYVRRTWTPYGFPPTERALIPIATGLKRQQWALDYFASGSIPGVFVVPDKSITNPQQLRQLQDALNAIAGDLAFRHQAIVLPGGSRVHETRDRALASEFDHLVIDQVAMAFDVTPSELGLMPSGRSEGLGGSGFHRAQAALIQRKATKPLLRWLKRAVFDLVIQELCGRRDLEWHWLGLEEAEDEEKKARINQIYVQLGVKSIDEVRTELGLPPWGLPETSIPMTFGPTAPTPLAPEPPLSHAALEEALEDEGEEPPPVLLAAQLAEVTALGNYVRHGKPVEAFRPAFLSPALVRAAAVMVAELGYRPGVRLVKRKLALSRRAHRERVLAPIRHRLIAQLRSHLYQAAGASKAAGPHTVDTLVSLLRAGYGEAFAAGRKEARAAPRASATWEAWLDDRAAAQRDYVTGFLQDVLAGALSDDAIDARLNLYAGTLTGAYEAGYASGVVDTVADGDDEAVQLTWYTSGDTNVCALCAERDGKSYTLAELLDEGFPGDGDFGDRCEGGPNCRCVVVYETTGKAVLALLHKRGNPEALIRWYVDDPEGRIRWGEPGDFDRCVAIASQYMDEEQAKGFCNLRHEEALGEWPAQHAAEERGR